MYLSPLASYQITRSFAAHSWIHRSTISSVMWLSLGATIDRSRDGSPWIRPSRSRWAMVHENSMRLVSSANSETALFRLIFLRSILPRAIRTPSRGGIETERAAHAVWTVRMVSGRGPHETTAYTARTAQIHRVQRHAYHTAIPPVMQVPSPHNPNRSS